MKIGILRIGHVDSRVIERVRENLKMTFPETESKLIHKTLPVPQESFDPFRRQYRSNIILGLVRDYAEKSKDIDRVLGIIDVDLFVPSLNFVFGEAECPGKAAIISLWRLRQEFYNAPSNFELFVERSTKEAVHELGHTLGLGHCSNPFCVMYFSNSIFETDRKKSLFCNKCHLKVQMFAAGLGGKP
jgi:archaemetzincin